LEEHSPDTFDLFVQWLHTRTHAEKAVRVPAFGTSAMLDGSLALLAMTHDGTSMMDWSIKAAILVWEMGCHFCAVEFQNHAMKR
jgi:hypothetical protein